LNIRLVDAGSCNGCEAVIVALNNPYYDLERFNIHFVASPKHADMLLVTGPVTRNMAEALRHTYEATPSPKLVVAVGACGISNLQLPAGASALHDNPGLCQRISTSHATDISKAMDSTAFPFPCAACGSSIVRPCVFPAAYRMCGTYG
jgi:hypothetical protein